MARRETTQHGSLTVLDLFAGAGGLSLGFESAGYRIVAGSDYDPDAMATYARNFPNATTVIGDVREPAIRDQILAVGSEIDVVIGGPPCQAFSQVRNHSRIIDDPRNSLYREFVRIVDDLEPRAFVMENVPGMDQMGVRDQVETDLSLGGKYRVTAQLLDAANFGVPQTRKRLVFIGIHRRLGLNPPTLHGTGATAALTLLPDSLDRRGYRLGLRADVVAEELLDRLRDPNDIGVVSASQAISDLRFLRAGDREPDMDVSLFPSEESAYQRLMRAGSYSMPNLVVPRMNADTQRRLESIPAGGNHRDLPEHLRARYLSDKRWGPNNGSEQLSRKHYYAYRRLHPDLWAWTLNTKADAVYHFEQARALSVREFCRLQSFPDRFEVVTDPRKGLIQGRMPNGAGHSRYRQVGNAVPPLLASAVAAQLQETLNASVVNV